MDGDLGCAVDGGSGRGCWWLLGHCAASAGTGGRSSAVGCPAVPCDVFHVGKIQNQKSSELRHGNSFFFLRFDLWNMLDMIMLFVPRRAWIYKVDIRILADCSLDSPIKLAMDDWTVRISNSPSLFSGSWKLEIQGEVVRKSNCSAPGTFGFDEVL